MTICTRPGCGVDFDPSSSESRQGPCKHHPGKPIFHEGSKSWSCCKDQNKPVLEFDEFLLIKGCKEEEEHTNVKQEKVSFAKENVEESSAAVNGQAKAPAPAPVASTSSLTPMSSTRLNAIQQQNAQRSQKSDSSKLFVEEEDPVEAVQIGKGTSCKRKGCNEKFTGEKRDRNSEKCNYHPGQAIFHEGSKGYACCKRRVLEFDEFLTIEPCTKAKSGHLFVGGGSTTSQSNGSSTDEIEADCRIDHYETPNDVRVTVYAKGVEMERSKITLEGESVTFSLALPALPAQPNTKRRYNRILKPYAAIDEKSSSFSVTRFKVDLILVKQAKGESWPALERGDQALGYGLTFGRKLDA
ncbi:hypothetical protein L7F22_050270 [Adiantum nelumboides]|nr:hypothetical protein [Adiantum nelumboides]